jgi:hypothetical protein
MISAARLNYNKKKTVVVASTNALAKQVAKILKDQYNISVNSARTTRDLGLDAGAGTRRTTAVSGGRVTKAVSKLRKTKGLVQANQACIRVIRTGAEPTWAYGVEAYGLANATLGKLRSATAYACNVSGVQSCPIMSVRIVLGPQGDPLFVATRASILWWVDCWGAEKQMRSILRKTWHYCWSSIVGGGEVIWAKVKGPVGTTIANLTRIGWTCDSPEVWVDENKVKWEILDNPTKASYSSLSDAIRDSCTALLNQAACQHRGGGHRAWRLYACALQAPRQTQQRPQPLW